MSTRCGAVLFTEGNVMTTAHQASSQTKRLSETMAPLFLIQNRENPQFPEIPRSFYFPLSRVLFIPGTIDFW